MSPTATIWPNYVSDSVGRGWAFTLPDGTTETLYFVRHEDKRVFNSHVSATNAEEVEPGVLRCPVPVSTRGVLSSDRFAGISREKDSSHVRAEAHRATVSRLASRVKRALSQKGQA
jgi:hypothetical protein